MKLINYAPHEIVVCDSNGAPIIKFPASGKTCRVSAHTKERCDVRVNGINIPVVNISLGEAQGLEDWDGKGGVIVSAMAADALAKEGLGMYQGIFYPDTGPGSAVRNIDGQLVGVRRLAAHDV